MDRCAFVSRIKERLVAIDFIAQRWVPKEKALCCRPAGCGQCSPFQRYAPSSTFRRLAVMLIFSIF
jgi:hypothetical protein